MRRRRGRSIRREPEAEGWLGRSGYNDCTSLTDLEDITKHDDDAHLMNGDDNNNNHKNHDSIHLLDFIRALVSQSNGADIELADGAKESSANYNPRSH